MRPTSTNYLALTGAQAIGFDKYMSDADQKKFLSFLKICTKLHTNLKIAGDFRCGVKKGGDVTNLDPADFPNSCAAVIFVGNLLHMLDPAAAKKMMKTQANRVLKKDGYIFISVDGIYSDNQKAIDAYQAGKAEKRLFPSVLLHKEIGWMNGDAFQKLNENSNNVLGHNLFTNIIKCDNIRLIFIL